MRHTRVGTPAPLHRGGKHANHPPTASTTADNCFYFRAYPFSPLCTPEVWASKRATEPQTTAIVTQADMYFRSGSGCEMRCQVRSTHVKKSGNVQSLRSPVACSRSEATATRPRGPTRTLSCHGSLAGGGGGGSVGYRMEETARPAQDLLKRAGLRCCASSAVIA